MTSKIFRTKYDFAATGCRSTASTGVPCRSAGEAAVGGETGAGDGTTIACWQTGQLICRPAKLVSHWICWPHCGQKNLNSAITLIGRKTFRFQLKFPFWFHFFDEGAAFRRCSAGSTDLQGLFKASLVLHWHKQ